MVAVMEPPPPPSLPVHRRCRRPRRPPDAMPLHHRRALLSDDCDPWYNCPPPPSPPFFTLSPSPSPSPPITSPPPWTPPFNFLPFPGPDLAPSPSPVHDGGSGGGRRDEGGTYGYGPVGGAIADHRRRFITYTLSAAAALAFLSLILLGISIAVRRRQQRRRRQALLAQAPAAATNVGNDDPEGGGGGGVVHHVWYIRTVGLDEAAIDSIAVTPYRAGSGLLGAADCSVCLGEFNDGELVRLLPKCGHAFHVPCIDTWLRAHVNCPLCRSDVLDPAAAAAGVDTESNIPADPYVSVNAVAEQGAAASDPTELDHEDDEEEEGQEAPRVEEDQHEQQLSPPEPLPQLPRPLLRNVRRAASMNAAMVSAAADVAALDRLPDAAPEEEEQNGGVKHQSGATGHASTERLPRSFFSRHCRARSSVLPL